MTRPADGADAVIADLMKPPIVPTEIAAKVPREPGLYAWWAHPAILPTMPGPAHPDDPGIRLLYVGLATSLRSPPLRPPLNVAHASGPARDAVKTARKRYYGSAGPRP